MDAAGCSRIEAYRSVKARLHENGIQEADREAKLIIAQAINEEIAGIFLHAEKKLSQKQSAKMQYFLNRRLSGMPLQYAMKTAYFMARSFYVDRRVLIPRPETEILTEQALQRLKQGKKSILDLCTGSGCIAVSLAAMSRDSNVFASDKYSKALTVAQKNAKINGVEDKITWIKSDMFENIDKRFDVIVSNPPYISRAEYDLLEDHVRRYEPKHALLANDGLFYYRIIARQAATRLNENGEVLLEIGCSQAKDVARLFLNSGFCAIACIKDYSGRDRVLTARRGQN